MWFNSLVLACFGLVLFILWCAAKPSKASKDIHMKEKLSNTSKEGDKWLLDIVWAEVPRGATITNLDKATTVTTMVKGLFFPYLHERKQHNLLKSNLAVRTKMNLRGLEHEGYFMGHSRYVISNLYARLLAVKPYTFMPSVEDITLLVNLNHFT